MKTTLWPCGKILPALALLVMSASIFLSGCHETVCPETVLNEDSIRVHAISITEAAMLTAHFRNTVAALDKTYPGLKDSLRPGYAEAFNGDTYRILLQQKDSLGRPAAGIRIYYGLGKDKDGKDGQVKLIMVPIDSNGNDILHHLVSTEKPTPGAVQERTQAAGNSTAQAMEEGQHCPTYCPPTPSPLQP